MKGINTLMFVAAAVKLNSLPVDADDRYFECYEGTVQKWEPAPNITRKCSTVQYNACKRDSNGVRKYDCAAKRPTSRDCEYAGSSSTCYCGAPFPCRFKGDVLPTTTTDAVSPEDPNTPDQPTTSQKNGGGGGGQKGGGLAGSNMLLVAHSAAAAAWRRML